MPAEVKVQDGGSDSVALACLHRNGERNIVTQCHALLHMREREGEKKKNRNSDDVPKRPSTVTGWCQSLQIFFLFFFSLGYNWHAMFSLLKEDEAERVATSVFAVARGACAWRGNVVLGSRDDGGEEG